MNQFGVIAVRAVGLVHSGECSHPREAWDKAAKNCRSKKNCPRSVFLGLCIAGKVKNIAPEIFFKKNEKPSLNGERALQIYEILKKNPQLKDAAILKKLTPPVKSNDHQVATVRCLYAAELLH